MTIARREAVFVVVFLVFGHPYILESSSVKEKRHARRANPSKHQSMLQAADHVNCGVNELRSTVNA
jgi:hypothetical protein